MSANKKPKKSYRPRYVCPNPLAGLLGGLSQISKAAKIRIAIINHSAVYAFARGKATRSDWDHICALIGFIEIMLGLYFTEQHQEIIEEAQIAHADAGKRFLETDVFSYTENELSVINQIIDFNDQIMEQSLIVEVENANKILNASFD